MNNQTFWFYFNIALFGVLIYATVLFFLQSRAITRRGDGDWDLNSFCEKFGFLYDREQDIFYSAMDAWQRDFGYCRFYDEAMAPLSMIVDADPIRFSYGGKHWLIEFWKGQYGMTSGAEVGVYTTGGPDLGDLTFYGDTLDEDHLDIQFSLLRNGISDLHRSGVHWWLTGFRLGEFSWPRDLALSVSVTAKNEEMRIAFLAALQAAGYTAQELAVDQNSVRFIYTAPRTPQPSTRTRWLERFVQRRNKKLCDLFQALTGHLPDMDARLSFLQKNHPDVYRKVVRSLTSTKRYAKYAKGKRVAERGKRLVR